MFRKIYALTAPSPFSAASLMMALVMLFPSVGLSLRATSILAESVAATISVSAETVEEETVEKREPVREETATAYKISAPPSIANAIVDLTPQMEKERMERETEQCADVSFSLPEEKHINYYLNEEEYKMLCWCVEGEARGKSLMHREIITQVIFNRVFNPRFPDTVKEVLTAPNQFNAMDCYNPDYFDSFVTPLTKEAVYAVLNLETDDLSQGALYFCNPNTAVSADWFEYRLTRLFDLENHRFYTYP